MNSPVYKKRLFAPFLFLAAALISSCTPAGRELKEQVRMAPMTDMPSEVQTAPVSVREAYRFAAANPEVLKSIPCYCGCDSIGHTSNYACYVQSQQDEQVVFDSHALGCGICVDITRDVMQMTGEGMGQVEMRAAIDREYARYGHSNMP